MRPPTYATGTATCRTPNSWPPPWLVRVPSSRPTRPWLTPCTRCGRWHEGTATSLRKISDLEARMLARATAANPALLAIKGDEAVIGAQLLITAGDNPDRLRTSASFAALCGTAPIPVSSGRTNRHRLSRGGDRQANAALHHIVKARMSYDPATRAYRDANLAKGWTLKAMFRALKRAVAREVFNALTGRYAVPSYSDLRPARRAKNLTLTAAANHLGVWPARIGELELGRRPNDELAARYRAWLQAA